MACDSCKPNLEQETRAIRGAAEMAQKYRILVRAVIALAFGFFIMVGCCIWAVVNAQTIANEAMIEALNTVAEIGVTQETTATTTQTVDGDSTTINNVEGEQYNDNAQNGGGE